MKILLVALMTMIPSQPEREFFIFTSHEFKNVQECKTFAQQNMQAVIYRLWSEYGPRKPEMISCVDEKTINKLTNGIYNKATEA
tara:strand:+ start:540 stop:791 length:252 start_codon:yes stop_codon:yes gene_type:complete